MSACHQNIIPFLSENKKSEIKSPFYLCRFDANLLRGLIALTSHALLLILQTKDNMYTLYCTASNKTKVDIIIFLSKIRLNFY